MVFACEALGASAGCASEENLYVVFVKIKQCSDAFYNGSVEKS